MQGSRPSYLTSIQKLYLVTTVRAASDWKYWMVWIMNVALRCLCLNKAEV